MARGDYGPEVRSAMNEDAGEPPRSPAEEAKAKSNPIGQRPRTLRGGKPSQKMAAPKMPTQMQPKQVPVDAHHVAAAASIAHAILGNRGMR